MAPIESRKQRQRFRYIETNRSPLLGLCRRIKSSPMALNSLVPLEVICYVVYCKCVWYWRNWAPHYLLNQDPILQIMCLRPKEVISLFIWMHVGCMHVHIHFHMFLHTSVHMCRSQRLTLEIFLSPSHLCSLRDLWIITAPRVLHYHRPS